jgi:hypothetical protein
MANLSRLKKDMEVIGADGVHIGTIDKVEGRRLKLTKADSGSHQHHHHYLSAGLVADIEGNQVRLSANGDAAVLLEEEGDGRAIADRKLWTWTGIGIGAATVGVIAAVAGSSLRRRERGKERS